MALAGVPYGVLAGAFFTSPSNAIERSSSDMDSLANLQQFIWHEVQRRADLEPTFPIENFHCRPAALDMLAPDKVRHGALGFNLLDGRCAS